MAGVVTTPCPVKPPIVIGCGYCKDPAANNRVNGMPVCDRCFTALFTGRDTWWELPNYKWSMFALYEALSKETKNGRR